MYDGDDDECDDDDDEDESEDDDKNDEVDGQGSKKELRLIQVKGQSLDTL